MNNIHMEFMRPGQIIAARDKCPVVYVPIAPLEWHGPHLPIGVDAIHAAKASECIARIVGGLVYPTTFFGTETCRDQVELRNLGFTGDEHIVGMDFPANILPSVYYEESVFGIEVKEIVRLLKKMQFKAIFLMSGHGALNHGQVLERIANEEADNQCQVVYKLVFSILDSQKIQRNDSEHTGLGVGHASKDETSIMLHLNPELVDLSELPEGHTKLYYKDWAIVDGPAFAGNPTKDHTVRPGDDPRQATAEYGRKFLMNNITSIAAEIKQFLLNKGIIVETGFKGK